MSAYRNLLATLLLSTGLLLWTPAVQADKQSQAVYQRTLRSSAFVLAQIPGSKDGSSGTGWVISRSRKLLITNHHVILVKGKVARDVLVLFPSYAGGRVIAENGFYFDPKNRGRIRVAKGRVLHSDSLRDLALIQLDNLPSDMTSLKLATTSAQPGERVHSVGNPGAARPGMWIYTAGMVRQVFHRNLVMTNGQRVNARILLTQSPTNPGDSGGPLVNDRAELVGVTSSSESARLITNFIDVSEVVAFWRNAKSASGGSFAQR